MGPWGSCFHSLGFHLLTCRKRRGSLCFLLVAPLWNPRTSWQEGCPKRRAQASQATRKALLNDGDAEWSLKGRTSTSERRELYRFILNKYHRCMQQLTEMKEIMLGGSLDNYDFDSIQVFMSVKMWSAWCRPSYFEEQWSRLFSSILSLKATENIDLKKILKSIKKMTIKWGITGLKIKGKWKPSEISKHGNCFWSEHICWSLEIKALFWQSQEVRRIKIKDLARHSEAFSRRPFPQSAGTPKTQREAEVTQFP